MYVFSFPHFTFWKLSKLSLYLNHTLLLHLLSNSLHLLPFLVQIHLPYYPIHNWTFVTLRSEFHRTCNISWVIIAWSRRSIQPTEKSNGEEFSMGGWLSWEHRDSPHCLLDIRSVRLTDGTAVWWNMSRERLLWWTCSRQTGGRQYHITTKKL